MKRKKLIAVLSVTIAVVLIVLTAGFFLKTVLTDFIDDMDIVCPDQKFNSAEEAIAGLEAEETAEGDIELDYPPPHKLMYQFDYEDTVIVFYSHGGSHSYAVRVLKRNPDNTLSFTSGFADFKKIKPTPSLYDYYYYTNIETGSGRKAICFLYMPEDFPYELTVDGIPTTKLPVTVDGESFYICYATLKRDMFFDNLHTPVAKRHTVELVKSQNQE